MPSIDNWLRGRAMGPSADWLQKIAETYGGAMESVCLGRVRFACGHERTMYVPALGIVTEEYVERVRASCEKTICSLCQSEVRRLIDGS